MKRFKKYISIWIASLLIISGVGCSKQTSKPTAKKNGQVIILYTTDIHCGIEEGFGVEGLQQIRDTYEAAGYTTLLVDNGDALQGEAMGSFTKGESMITIMNALKYDVAIPGNHDFDYGVDRLLELSKEAQFPYICCNLNKEGELVFAPYIIKEAEGMKIAFVGVTTPTTITSSTPKYFENDKGEFIYDFMQDETGEKLYDAVQKAVDDARKESADYVYLMAHLGLHDIDAPWTYADVISHTNGIDVLLDGHSHDTEQIVMKNKDGEDVLRSAAGTKLDCIGYSIISPTDGITETKILTWSNEMSAPDLFAIENSITPVLNQIEESMATQLNEVVGKTKVDLTIVDPEAVDSNGLPVRIVRNQDTNLSDLVTDAFLDASEADISLVNGGGIRQSIRAGDITYGDVLEVFPFNNQMCVIEATGQQILDALEWGAQTTPDENGAFLHTAGMTYDIDVSIPTPCKSNESGMLTSIEGERRVKNVMVNGEPIDPAKTYTVAGIDYVLLNKGDGNTAFADAKVLENQVKKDAQVIIDFITDKLKGEVGDEYSNPYGQGRITILNGE